MPDKEFFVVLNLAGAVCPRTLTHTGLGTARDYLSLLEAVATYEPQGNNDTARRSDIPYKLLRNGHIIVEKDLFTLAKHYYCAKHAAMEEAAKKVQESFTPEWMKQETEQ